MVRVRGSGFGFRGSRFEVRGSRFEVRGSRSEVRGPRFDRLEVRGSRFEVRGSRFEVRGSRFEVRGSRFEVRGSRRFVLVQGMRRRSSSKKLSSTVMRNLRERVGAGTTAKRPSGARSKFVNPVASNGCADQTRGWLATTIGRGRRSRNHDPVMAVDRTAGGRCATRWAPPRQHSSPPLSSRPKRTARCPHEHLHDPRPLDEVAPIVRRAKWWAESRSAALSGRLGRRGFGRVGVAVIDRHFSEIRVRARIYLRID